MKSNRRRTLTLAVSLLFIGINVPAQDSCGIQISLLTCSPAKELYSTFGHTAIRVQDMQSGNDLVFNYGTFDDSDPYFYVKFTRGLMRYALSVESFPDFMEAYREEKRAVVEQVLQLSCTAREQLFDSLRTNAQESNRFYDYYFHTDNCTTRARDIITAKAGGTVTFNPILPTRKPSYRQLLHEYLDKSHSYWSKFGIDVLLGTPLDKHVTDHEATFLPDYLMMALDSARVNGHPLVARKKFLLQAEIGERSAPWFTPTVFFTVLLVLIAFASFFARNSRALALFDRVFFLCLGLLGVVILLLWTIRLDTVCRNNFNVLWALPTHVVVVFVAWRRKTWIPAYFRITLILSILFAVSWPMLPQQFNLAILPVLGCIVIRSYYRSRP